MEQPPRPQAGPIFGEVTGTETANRRIERPGVASERKCEGVGTTLLPARERVTPPEPNGFV